ncbi:MAG TPA: WYL domain-containing protein [Hyphomicrobiaceae bacterium]|nr:WYL domain-containing protein [Hyphomicrobiaceae bacterium]
MSYSKARDLMMLAIMAAGRYVGVTLDDVKARFRTSKRTAQRMTHALEEVFPETVSYLDNEGRKRWRLESGVLRELMSLTPEELAALNFAIESLRRSGLAVEADDLRNVRDKIMALVPRGQMLRIEPDLEALMEAQGLAARPGPRQRVDRQVVAAIAEGIKACRLLDVEYRARGEIELKPRQLVPYGLLTGLRRYLVARSARDPSGPTRLYILDSIGSARVTNEAFERDPAFRLDEFATRAFGVFQNEDELGDVVWRFSPAAAERARQFQFHPSQQVEEQPDGSLVVSFCAAGHLEMCWHLYIWGDQVEVLEPERLRDMVHAWRRSDFPSLP